MRAAIVDAAQCPFLGRGFGAVSMGDLLAAPGVARRMLYNQLASSLREVVLRVSAQFFGGRMRGPE